VSWKFIAVIAIIFASICFGISQDSATKRTEAYIKFRTELLNHGCPSPELYHQQMKDFDEKAEK
jgi:hypothetical protein